MVITKREYNMRKMNKTNPKGKSMEVEQVVIRCKKWAYSLYFF